VRAKSTSDATIHALVSLVKRLGKTPIVVADSPGFLVNRILFPYLDEGVRMVCEGIAVDEIDRKARRFGMPMGPLELLDEVGLNVAVDVAKTLAPFCPDPTPTPERLSAMVARGWLGKKSGCGFYHWKNGRRGQPSSVTPPHSNTLPEVEGTHKLSIIQQRLIYQIVNESARCLGEHVVGEAWMVDLAMVLGTGFAPFTGGPLRFADSIGLQTLLQELAELHRQFGDRFTPSSILLRLGVEGQTTHPAATVGDTVRRSS
jgi:3-hydroxyacyl-CoA dehydrogenase/enoyl-CoA hydratase/3-hydroxybutyryl-CoA epimerase